MSSAASHRGERAVNTRLTPPPEREFPARRLQPDGRSNRVRDLRRPRCTDAAPPASSPRTGRRPGHRRHARRGSVCRLCAHPGRDTGPDNRVLRTQLAPCKHDRSSRRSRRRGGLRRDLRLLVPGLPAARRFRCLRAPSGSVGVFPAATTGDTCKSSGSPRRRPRTGRVRSAGAATAGPSARAEPRAGPARWPSSPGSPREVLGLEHLEHRRLERRGRVVERIEKDCGPHRQLLLLAVHP